MGITGSTRIMTYRGAAPRRQRGQALIDAAFAAAIMALIYAGYLIFAHNNQVTENASAQGQYLSQMAVGLRGFVADVQNTQITLPTNPYTVAGVSFLKAPGCGGLAGNPVQGFVPCDYSGGTYGPQYQTTITYTPASSTIEALTSYNVQPPGTDSAGGMLASAVAYAANAQAQPQNGMFQNTLWGAPLGTDTQPGVSTVTPANRNRVTLVVNNSPSNDLWLRVDGTNKMLADLNMGGNSLVNANNGLFAGSVHINGTAQIDNGLSVTSGTADLRGGVIAPDVAITSIGRMASQAIYDAEVLTGSTSYTVAQPNCTAANLGASSPAIYVAMQGTGSPGGHGDALYEAHVQVVNNGATWTVTPVVEATTFTLGGTSSGGNLTLTLNKTLTTLNPADQTILVMTKCR